MTQSPTPLHDLNEEEMLAPALLATQPCPTTFESPLHGLKAATVPELKLQLQGWAAGSGFAISFLCAHSHGTVDAICKKGGAQRPDGFLKPHAKTCQQQRRSVKNGYPILVRISKLGSEFLASTALGSTTHNRSRLPQGAFSEQRGLSQRCLNALGPLADEGRPPRDIEDILHSSFTADIAFVPMKTIYRAFTIYPNGGVATNTMFNRHRRANYQNSLNTAAMHVKLGMHRALHLGYGTVSNFHVHVYSSGWSLHAFLTFSNLAGHPHM